MAPLRRTTAFDLAAALVTASLCLPTAANGGTASHAQSPPDRASRVQATGFEAAHELRAMEHVYGEAHAAPEALHIAHRITLDRFNPGLGTLEAVRLTLRLHVEHAFSGSVGDGLPLNESGEPVAVMAALETALEVLGPDGALIATRTIAGDPAGCTGMRACMFTHAAKVPVAVDLDLQSLTAFTLRRPTITVRLATTAPVLPMLCDAEGLWDRCRLEQARIAISASERGALVTYHYRPAPRTAPVEGSTLPSALSRTGLIVALVVSSLLGLVVLLRRRRYP